MQACFTRAGATPAEITSRVRAWAAGVSGAIRVTRRSHLFEGMPAYCDVVFPTVLRYRRIRGKWAVIEFKQDHVVYALYSIRGHTRWTAEEKSALREALKT